ncbi:MAG: ion transporter [Mariprofundus sp.]|nr:ion transporter [Mariprofundus sp.]
MPKDDQDWRTKPISNSIRARLNQCLFDLSSPIGRKVNQTLMLIILISVLVGMLASVGSFDNHWKTLFHAFEYGVTILFIIEYVLRLYSARNAFSYAFSFYGIVDLATLLPLLIFGDTNTVIRLLRVFRLLKLIRYLRALHLFVSSLRDVFEIMAVVIAGIIIIVMISGNLIYFLEPHNIANAFEGCWWSLVTMTTVGYGDIVPHSASGRALASVLILIGLTMFAMLTGTISVKVNHALSYQRECSACQRKVAQEFIYCPFCGATQHQQEQDDHVSQTDRHDSRQ